MQLYILFIFFSKFAEKYSMLNTTENNKVNEQALASNKREKTCSRMWYLFS